MNAYAELLNEQTAEPPTRDPNEIEQVDVEAPTGAGKSAYPAVLSQYQYTLSQVSDRSLITPQLYGLDFPDWRPNQLSTAFAIRDAYSDNVIGDRTVVLTQTKSLQMAYADFGAKVLFGRANYDCINPKADPGTKCNECLFAEVGMFRCEYYHDCPYAIAKEEATNSKFACVNYAYWQVARRFRDSAIANLVADECHLLDGITLNASGVILHDRTRQEYELPFFPIITGRDELADQEVACRWLERAQEKIGIVWTMYNNRAKMGDKRAAKEASKAERVGTNIANAVTALDSTGMAWYIRSGPGLVSYRGRMLPGIRVQPLTPRYHYKRLFFGDWRNVTMSATIGNFAAFDKNLGLKRTRNIRVPNVWSADTRPIHILDAPALNWKSPESARMKQAAVIASAIKSCPLSWSGIIHVKAKKEASALKYRLVKCGIPERRLWIPPEKDVFNRNYGTQEQVAMWHDHRRRCPDAIIVAWQFWEGYDGLDEQICIVAKVPYPYLGDEYEKMRMEFDRRMYGQRTAWQCVQAWGRTRRGRSCDYDDPSTGEIRGYVAIADMNVMKILGYMPVDILEALRSPSSALIAKINKAIKKQKGGPSRTKKR